MNDIKRRCPPHPTISRVRDNPLFGQGVDHCLAKDGMLLDAEQRKAEGEGEAHLR